MNRNELKGYLTETNLTNSQIDFLHDIAGEYLGENNNAVAFMHKYEIDKRIKVAKINSYSNNNEFEISNYVSLYRKDQEPWFAKVSESFFDSKIIIQEFTHPVYTLSELPSKLPSYAINTDLKDFGYRRGFIVISNYPNIRKSDIENSYLVSKTELSIFKPHFSNNSSGNPNIDILRRAFSEVKL